MRIKDYDFSSDFHGFVKIGGFSRQESASASKKQKYLYK